MKKVLIAALAAGAGVALATAVASGTYENPCPKTEKPCETTSTTTTTTPTETTPTETVPTETQPAGTPTPIGPAPPGVQGPLGPGEAGTPPGETTERTKFGPGTPSAAVPSDSLEALPLTGVDAGWVALAGLALLGAGAGMRRRA